jgi:anti-sigma regulatory factor (Ser/Thr protein kinase)
VSGRLREYVASRATGLTRRDEDLRRTREMAGTLMRTWSLGPALTTDLDVVLDEVLSNIVRHGLRDGREHEICMRSRSSRTP